jgi:DNA-binding transcriptional ArsR family regulator
MDILRILKDRQCCQSLEELSKKTKMSLPLISYHINGNLKSDGLKTMGLVETTEEKGRISVDLSSLGRMIVRGYIN